MLGFTVTITAQEKYAVLITGDYAAKNIPKSSQWNQGKSDPAEEFWYDTYLMWEMLTKPIDQGGKGFSDENVFVLFTDGIDYYFEGIYDRYKPPIGKTVTDYPATKANVELVFNGLADGTDGFPKVSADDYLLVWAYGYNKAVADEASTHIYSYLMNNEQLSYEEFIILINQINCNNKIINPDSFPNKTISK